MATLKQRLSTRQQAILDFIRGFVRDHGYPPTVREIGTNVGISSTSVVDYNLRILTERGLLKRDQEISRGISLVEDDEPEPVPTMTTTLSSFWSNFAAMSVSSFRAGLLARSLGWSLLACGCEPAVRANRCR